MAFTEQGIAMLSRILNSERAVQVNIQIMRALTYLRQILSTHEDLRRKIEAIKKKYDKQFAVVSEPSSNCWMSNASRSPKSDLRSRNASAPTAGRRDKH
jgi:hypothetical protein